MTGTAPRKKPKGEQAMRSYLIWTSAETRPRMESATRLQRVGAAQVRLPAGVAGAAHVLALLLAKGVTLAEGERSGHRVVVAHWLTYTNEAQSATDLRG